MFLMKVLNIFVCMNLLMSLCIFTMSNALLMSSAIVIVHANDCLWLELVVMVLLMLCNVVSMNKSFGSWLFLVSECHILSYVFRQTFCFLSCDVYLLTD